MKEVIKTIVIVLLVAVAVYFAFIIGKVNARMDVLNTQDSVIVEVNNEFDHNLHDLELQFIGRGKHIQQFQRALKDMDRKLDETAIMFAAKIDSVLLVFSEFQMNTETELGNLKSEQDQISDRLSELKRKYNRRLTDLETALPSINRKIGALEKRVKAVEPEEKEKKSRR
ncbi:MAG: hypothetical protein DRP89_01020 [Candidatus Neomarinimicrobiota bacterium]|nr:MAG: hypothetical protein DRP89_01020 [Candidatus Neomarinimicrobiota bacterium]